MNGRVLILCAGEQERWGSPAPKQLIRVVKDEVLLARTIRQCRARFSGEDPLLVTHLPCLRGFSRNSILPSEHRYTVESLRSVYPFWGENWTIVLLGDVFYTDVTLNTIIDGRAKNLWKFYGGTHEIYAFTFTDNASIHAHLEFVIYHAHQNNCLGKLWDLYYDLEGFPLPNANHKVNDDEHYQLINDGTRDFDKVEQYKEWRRAYERNELKL